MAEEQMDELMKIFPVKLREILSQVTWYREDLEEIRIRIQRPVQFVTSQASFYLDPREKRLMTQAKGGLALGEEDLREMLTYVCEYSRYAYARQMRQGFLALDGGIRLGLCGQYMAEEDGRIGMEYPMYFSIRIPHEKKECAAWIEPWLIEGETFLHTLILAAPGMGKTTFLRDLVRVLSDRPTCRGLALIDERYEVAAANFGIPQNDVGCQEANAFNFSHLTISISKDGISWIPLTYSRDNSKEWDLATVSFSLKQETSTLHFRFQTTVSNQIRVDDVKLSSGTTSTNIIDFGNVTQYPLVELPQLNLTINNYQYITHSATLNNRKVRNYTMCFDKNMHAAHWVAYPLHSSYRGGSGRTEAWAADPLIEEQYQPKLYGTDGLTFYRNYSRGHQIPSADRTANDELNNQTFYASNMTPPSGDFNGGIWGTLEGKIRDNICNDTLYVVTGCYFGNNYTTTRDGCNGNNESQISKDCPVPTHYFKVINQFREQQYLILHRVKLRWISM